jgi:glycosyltransferase involved in cell wall biosynthesis
MSEVRVSVVVPTRNRPQDIVPCVETVLAYPGSDMEVIVVDQSDDGATRDAIAALQRDPRLRYVRSDERGVSRARNLGIQSARGPIIAFTDDDCRVAPDWLPRLTDALAADADAALVFGRVTVPQDVDGRARWAASFEPARRQYQHGFPAPTEPWGIGANMAARRATFEAVGSFDPFLGPGGKFWGSEEYDLAIRVIAAGRKVLNISEASVLHLGVREGPAAVALLRRYAMSIGAMLAKHVRVGTRDSARLLTAWVGSRAKVAVVNTVTGRRPTNVGFLVSMVVGAARSCAQPVDKAKAVYRPGNASNGG